MKILSAFILVAVLAAPAAAQSAPAPAQTPAATKQMVLPSHGSDLLGVFYLAAGPGPHPTALLFHGFPGYEQNLDIAQYLRAHGWNVLAMHYRGSWGVKGDFSFEHAAEDADTQVHFVLNPANAHKYRIDPKRVIVIGHSMGGYMAASATAHNLQVREAVLISAWNIGADTKGCSSAAGIAKDAQELEADNNLTPLAGTSAEALAREICAHTKELNFDNFASAIAPRPVFVITANDGLAQVDQALVDALKKAGDAKVTERHWNTDHSYSGFREDLSRAILEWANGNLAK